MSSQELDIGARRKFLVDGISEFSDQTATDREEAERKLAPNVRNRDYEKIIYQDDNSLDQWCAIRVIKYRYRVDQVKNQEKTMCDIMLPMPLQLQTGYTQQWTELDDISAILGQVASTASGEVDLGNLLKNPLETMSQLGGAALKRGSLSIDDEGSLSSGLMKNLLLNPAATAGLGGLIGAAIGPRTAATLGATAAGISRAVGTVGGLAANKYQTVTFEKPQLRQHNFSWNLVARSPEQATRMQKIINRLKWHSSPGQIDGSFGFFEYPELFALHFDSGEGSPNAKSNKNLFSISPSAMSSFNVDYHGTGRPLYSYDDKQPLSVTISMTLQEVVVVTKNTIDKFNR